MSVLSAVPAGLACLAIGTALYFSRAVLDRVAVADGSTRIAFLPAWPAWIGFVLVATLALWGVSRLARRSARGERGRRPSVGTLALPCLALVTLTLPYWPWLPDALPVIQMLAGPGRALVWLAVIGQVVWVVMQTETRHVRWLDRISLDRRAALVAVGTIAVSGLAAARLTNTTLFPAGDEPHYLVIAQSLWRDGDLAIENNHGGADYREYFPRDLEPHYLTRGVDGEIYSIHPIGLPVLLAPIYALGGYRLVVAVLIAAAGLAAAVMWRWSAGVTKSAGGATFAWVAIVGSAPFLLNTFTVYPEIAAALATIVGFTVASSLGRVPRPSRAIIVGLASAVLPWLSTKYAPMSAALVAIGLGRLWLRWPTSVERAASPNLLAPSGMLVMPYFLSLAAWFSFFYAYWGSPFPQAPYGSLVQTDPENVLFGVPGLFFDQEYGLLAYAPVYILAATGLVSMWRTGNDERRCVIEIALMFTALAATVGAFRIWWGGSASPGRPLVSGLLLLGMPMAVAFRSAAQASARRAAQHLLLWVSIGVSLTLVFAQNGLLIGNGRDGSSALVEYLSPLWEAWTLVPSFIHHEAGTALLHSLAWLAAAAAAAAAMRHVRSSTAGGASIAALTITVAALLAVVLVVPQLPSDPPQPSLDLRARARLGSLDSFDRVARPTGVIYDPWRTVPSSELISMLTLRVEPGARRDPQPVRVLHNGRFSLPAGRYRLDVQWSPRDPMPQRGAQQIEWQVGRIGPPLEKWSLVAAPGQLTQTEFALPVDAGFVGFRGSLDVERSIASLTITPLDIVDVGMRLRTPPVLAASRYVNAIALFHDEQTFPEPSGFWTVPGRPTTLTLVLPPGQERPTVLLLHPGPRPNHVAVTTYGWRGEMDLVPGLHSSLPLPDPTRRIVPLSIGTAAGFVPSEIDPGSSDRRTLGAWVEIAR